MLAKRRRCFVHCGFPTGGKQTGKWSGRNRHAGRVIEVRSRRPTDSDFSSLLKEISTWPCAFVLFHNWIVYIVQTACFGDLISGLIVSVGF